jgi:hypothetical protein
MRLQRKQLCAEGRIGASVLGSGRSLVIPEGILAQRSRLLPRTAIFARVLSLRNRHAPPVMGMQGRPRRLGIAAAFPVLGQ